MWSQKKEEESVESTFAEKLMEDKGYAFKKIGKDVYKSHRYVEKDWYEPKGTDSIWYHYLGEDIQYILRWHAEK